MKRTILSRMGIFAAFEDADNSQGLSAEGQADSIAEVLLGGSSDAKDLEEEETAEAVEVDEEDTEADLEEEETPPEESNEDESDESDEDETWESVLGVDEGQLSFDEEGNMSGFNVKVNGESSTVAMKDLVMGYQNNQANTQKSQSLAEERRSFEEKSGTVAQEYKTKLDNVEAMSNFLSEKLVGEYNNIDWDQLRVNDPAEYAAARQDYSARAQEIQEAQNAIKMEKEAVGNASMQKNAEDYQANLQDQRVKMIENNPTWSNQETFQKDMGSMKTFLSNQYGFNDQDFAQVGDSRLIELIKDAKSFREGVKFANKKISKPVPKFQKSVGKTRKKTSKLDRLTSEAKKATGSAKRGIQTDAITQLLMGG